jgi:hypothetical protein
LKNVPLSALTGVILRMLVKQFFFGVLVARARSASKSGSAVAWATSVDGLHRDAERGRSDQTHASPHL